MSQQIKRTILHPAADILLSALVLTTLLLLLGVVGAQLLELGSDYLVRAALLFAACIVMLIYFACREGGIRRFGAANRITLVRMSLLVLVTAALGEAPSDPLSWTIVAVTTLALILDGFDGYVARQSDTASSFGARFDMETDALTVMVLAILCWQFGKAGSWIVAAGAMRYAYVLAAAVLPWMRRPLPYSRRRQTICILQSAGLLGVISPVFVPPASMLLGVGLVLMLAASFAIDIHWLWNQRIGR